MMPNLANRLQDIPGVESVVVDLEGSESEGIHVRIEEGSDEADVLERVQALLVAYGVRTERSPILKVGRRRLPVGEESLGVEIKITPVKGGARVEVFGRSVRSFRIAASDPTAIAQSLADAWCQVLARVPVEISAVSLGDNGELTVASSDGFRRNVGRANVNKGWEEALALAVGRAIGAVTANSEPNSVNLAGAGW